MMPQPRACNPTKRAIASTLAEAQQHWPYP
jgi:hypothetical protein